MRARLMQLAFFLKICGGGVGLMAAGCWGWAAVQEAPAGGFLMSAAAVMTAIFVFQLSAAALIDAFAPPAGAARD